MAGPFDRVAAFNACSDAAKLRQAYFALLGPARIYYENHEASFADWDGFKGELMKPFTSIVRKERAQFILESKIQLPNQSVLINVEGMKCLFHRVDPTLSEETKTEFLMRGAQRITFWRSHKEYTQNRHRIH